MQMSQTMTLWEAVQFCKNTLLQNWSSAWYGDNDYVAHINRAIAMLYDRINLDINWYWSKVEEVISPDDEGGNIYTPAYTMSKILWVASDWRLLKMQNKTLLMPWSKWDYTLDRHWRIVWKWLQGRDITVAYHRKAKKLYTDQLASKLDVPEDLEWLIIDLVCWKALPVYLYNGASLWNNYYNQFNEQIVAYIKSVGYLDEQCFIN